MRDYTYGEHPIGSTKDVLEYVEIERLQQYKKWGDQHHDIYKWLAILTEEVGEAAQAALDAPEHVRKELIQVAAVAVQIIENIDKNNLKEVK